MATELALKALNDELRHQEPLPEAGHPVAAKTPSMCFDSTDALSEYLLDALLSNGHPFFLATKERERMKRVIVPTDTARTAFNSLSREAQSFVLIEVRAYFDHVCSFQAFEGMALQSARMNFHDRVGCALTVDDHVDVPREGAVQWG